MIKKPRDIPLKILKLEALLRRLSQFHPSRKRLEDELAKNYAGYKGELAVDYQLKFLKEDNWQFFFNVRLAGIKDTFFQMDSLLVTDRFLVLLEIKNISGTLIFDQEFHQLIRVTSEQEDSYLDPLLQLQRQKVQMQTWLQTYKIPKIPISSLVVISQPSTRIKSTSNPTTLAKKVVHAVALPDMIHSFSTIYKDPILTKNEVNKLTKLLMKHNIESNPNVLNQFQINPNELQTGVHCPTCFSLPIARVKGSWFCHECQQPQRQAHLSALIDYSLLQGLTITNRQCRNYLHIPSQSSATKLLASLNLSYSGSFRNRQYHLSLDSLQSRLFFGKK